MKLNVPNENKFYKKIALKKLLDDGKTIHFEREMNALLHSAWNECKNNKELREGFFVVCFSIGDITNRQHNIFDKKVDNGGEACRIQMIWILKWILKNHSEQFYNFMDNRIINEYVSWFALLCCQVKTAKKTKVIVDSPYTMLYYIDLSKLANYIVKILKTGSIADKMLLAKYLVLPKTSTRKKANGERRQLQSQTKASMELKTTLYVELSRLMNWEVIYHPHNIEFKGLKEFKKEFNKSFESVLFSTKSILNLDKEEFFNFLNSAPASARYRVEKRLKSGKWDSQLTEWYNNWTNFKEDKQQEQRDLTEKVRQGVASDEDKVKLEKVKKEAKITTGAVTLFDQISKFAQGNRNDVLMQSILDKINFQVPVLVVADCSGSMRGLPYDIASLFATTAMLKNPSNDLDDILIKFGSSCQIVTDRSKGSESINRFTVPSSVVVDKIIDRTKPFSWNYDNIHRLIYPNLGGTYLSSFSKELYNWVNSDASLRSVRSELLKQYPVFLVISDGDLNSDSSAKESMISAIHTLHQIGWDGVVVVWDVNTGSKSPNYNKFDDIENCIHYYGFNLGVINQLFTNIHDLDVIDIYTELNSLWKSNRYELIKTNTL
jgi:hypothetical protein